MRRVLLFLGTALLAQTAPEMGVAQAGKAELFVQVHDASGAVVPNARLTLSEETTNQSFLGSTGLPGSFTFSALKPGLYTLKVEAEGFKRFRREHMQLTVGDRARLEVKLAVGGVSEQIVVQGDPSGVRTESAQLGRVISRQAILDLPLKSRDFIGLVALSTGVALPPGSAFPRINGGRPRVNEYLYDGVSVLQPEPGQAAFFPIVDAIQEFQVHTNSPSAEFGRFSGGVVNLTTRSGTNEFHGSGFEFFRNEELNARNLFAPATATDPKKPVFRRNQFGIVLGGPVVRDRTFFFGDYQGTRQLVGRVRISTVPTVLQRQGIFTEPVGGGVRGIYDPANTTALPGGGFARSPFPGNAIPAGRIDSVAQRLLERYPMPASPGTSNNYRRVANEGQDQDQFDIRLDHRFTERNQSFARYSYALDDSVPVTPLPDGSGSLTSGALGAARTLGQSFAASDLHAFGPRFANELRFGYTRRTIDRRASLLDAPPSQSLGLRGIPAHAAFENELPTFAISGFQQLGPPQNTNADFRTDVTQVVETVSWQPGRHFVRAGLDFRFNRLDIMQPPSPTGIFGFSSLFSDLPGTANTGLALASFLLGQVQDFSIDLQSRAIRPRAMIQEYFVQDDWKVTERVTVNAGLRYTLNFPSTEVDDQGAVFNLATQRLEYLGRDGFPRTARELHKLNFGPRLGVAYRSGEKTVARAGYGLIWIDQAGVTTPFTTPQFPFIQTVSQRTLDNITPAFVLANGPNVQPIPLTPDAGVGQGVFSVDHDLGSGYAHHWNLAIQHELARDLTIEVAYAGSKGTHIGIPDTNLNQLTVQQLQLGTALFQSVPNPFSGQIPGSSSIGGPAIPRAQLLKPFPRFTTVSLYRNNVGNTIYHGLQVKLEKRWSQGLTFLAGYTRSKLIDEASSVFDASILTGPVANFPVADGFNRRLERDVSTGDMPDAFVASWVYDLPVGRGHRLGPRGVAGALLKGWQVSGIITLQSGLPLAVTQATNFNAFAGFGTQRPDCIANPTLPGDGRTTSRFFDTSAFQMAPQFALGSCSRNPVRGPAYGNADVSLAKRTSIGEKMELQFRAEIYNLTNTPPLGSPNVALGAAGFGSITSAGDPRVIQLALKVQF